MATDSLQTCVEADWTPRNLFALQRAIREAYAEVARVCDPETTPFFDTPNRTYGLGYNRWLAVDYYLHRAFLLGWFDGITAHWKPLGGKSGTPVSVMELTGTYTSVIAAHLRDPDERPRDSDYRCDMTASNEKYPRLVGFEEDVPEAPMLKLLLVHGDKAAEFAMLRAYDDLTNRSSFTGCSGNIMESVVPVVVEADDEQVPEPRVALRLDNEENEQPSAGS